jgi:hypothetical protein
MGETKKLRSKIMVATPRAASAAAQMHSVVVVSASQEEHRALDFILSRANINIRITM